MKRLSLTQSNVAGEIPDNAVSKMSSTSFGIAMVLPCSTSPASSVCSSTETSSEAVVASET